MRECMINIQCMFTLSCFLLVIVISSVVSPLMYSHSSQSCSQRPQSFWSATGIVTSGQVQHWKFVIQGLSVPLRMPRVKSNKSDWFWSQSIVFTKPFKTRMSLDLARGPDFQCMTKGTPGDEVALFYLFLNSCTP